MPEVVNMNDFAYTGIYHLLLLDRKTYEPKGYMEYLQEMNLSDEQPVEYLRGGYGNPKLIPFVGERETSITAVSATENIHMLGFKMGDETGGEVKEIEFSRKVIKTKKEGFVLPSVPSAARPIDVWSVATDGVRTKLVAGDGTQEGTYAISETTLTVPETVEKIMVYYWETTQVTQFAAKDYDPKAYRLVALMTAKDVSMNNFLVQLEAPSAVVQLNNPINASNSGDVPDPIEVTIDLLKDATEESVYTISFVANL